MTDIIEIHGLRARTILGVEDWERKDPRDVLIDLALHTDTRAAGQSDRLDDTLNYHAIADRVIQLVESSSFYLVERLAESVAVLCLKELGASRVRVTVEKPGALRTARSVGVTIERP